MAAKTRAEVQAERELRAVDGATWEKVTEVTIPLSTRNGLAFYFPVRDALRVLSGALIAAAEAQPDADLVVTVTRQT